MKARDKQYQQLLNLTRNKPFIEFIPIPIYGVDEEGQEQPVTKVENPTEPKNFTEFVGQEEAKEVLTIIVDSANKEKRLIPNILLTGAYGHGKTTLAKLIAKRHRKQVKIVDGSVAGITIKPGDGKIYIVDEAHNIPSQVTDSFNIYMDEGQLRLIACTTNPGALPAAFRSRFRSVYLTEYQPKHIAKIVERAAKKLKISVEKTGINIIANRSKCNPRAALAILDFVREMSVTSKVSTIGVDTVLSAVNKLGIDEIGLTTLDRRYLDTLRYDRPVGLQYISSILSLDADTVQEEVEPFLLRLGLIERTPRGRIRLDQEEKRAPAGVPIDLAEQFRRMLQQRGIPPSE